jgi:hypothetical protein
MHLYYELADHGVETATRVAELMGGELGWGEERIHAEAARYTELAGR